MNNIFLEKLDTKRDGEAGPKPFYKKSLGQQSDCYKICFHGMSRSKSTKIY